MRRGAVLALLGGLMPGLPALAQTADPHGGHHDSVSPVPATPSADWAADPLYPAGAMAQARAALYREHGGMPFALVRLNRLEAQGRGGYHWEGEGWWGGDTHRLMVKTEGSGAWGRGAEDAEVQALYARAIAPFWWVQAGVRHDFAPHAGPTYAVLAVEGLAPYRLETEAELFVSDQGAVRARLALAYDQFLTQRLIVQPRAEMGLSGQNRPEQRLGSGLESVTLGLRARYELRREVAPYLGLVYTTKLGTTADYARVDGDNSHSTHLVLGIRLWF